MKKLIIGLAAVAAVVIVILAKNRAEIKSAK